jgi:hypothetical protein
MEAGAESAEDPSGLRVEALLIREYREGKSGGIGRSRSVFSLSSSLCPLC